MNQINGTKRDKATPDEGTETEVEGHSRRNLQSATTSEPREGSRFAVEESARAEDDVQGHGRIGKFNTDAADEEVEGHMNSILAQELARARTQEVIDQADRARRTTDSAQPRDGSIVEKLRKLTDR